MNNAADSAALDLFISFLKNISLRGNKTDRRIGWAVAVSCHQEISRG